MTFVVVFVGLLIERFFDWSHLRVWIWFGDLQRLLIRQLQQRSGYVNLAISIVPVLFLVWLINHVFHGWMYGFPSLVFKVIVLIYCFGPQNIWADSFACINALKDGDEKLATERLKNAFGIGGSKTSQVLHRNLLSEIFIAANRRVFAVVFWFILLGPVAAVAYRLVSVSTGVRGGRYEVMPELSQPAQTVESALDWAPVRVMTIFFALSGQFVQVLKVWRKKAPLGLYTSDDMMSECGMAALGVEDNTDFPANCKMERGALSLIDRSLIIVMVILALVTLF